MIFYLTQESGSTLVFHRVEPTESVPATVRILVFRDKLDMTLKEPDLAFEINAEQFRKMADLVT